MSLLVEEVESSKSMDPVQYLRVCGRPFRLRMGGISRSRTIGREETRQYVKLEENADYDRYTLQEELFSKNEHLTKYAEARRDLLHYFGSRTICHPDPGVRMFLFDLTNVNVNDENEMMHSFGLQQSQFTRDMFEQIDIYEGAVKRLQENWDEVIRLSAKGYGTKFDPSNYMTAEQLPTRLYVNFVDCPTGSSADSEYLSPDVKARLRAAHDRELIEVITLEFSERAKVMTETAERVLKYVTDLDAYEKQSDAAKVRRPKVFGSVLIRILDEATRIDWLARDVLNWGSTNKLRMALNNVRRLMTVNDPEGTVMQFRNSASTRKQTKDAIDDVMRYLPTVLESVKQLH